MRKTQKGNRKSKTTDWGDVARITSERMGLLFAGSRLNKKSKKL